jgi:hypothetical protein
LRNSRLGNSGLGELVMRPIIGSPAERDLRAC